MGQESVVLKGGEVVIYIDPYMSADLERKAGFQRAFPAPLQPEHITNANMVLITHEHDDHMDLGTIAVIAKQNPATAFVAPACCHEAMRGVGVSPERLFAAVCDEWQQFDGFRLMAIPAAHETLDEHEEFGHRFVGYLVDIQGVLIYHAGDTVVYPGLVERLLAHSIDIGMVPINGEMPSAGRTASSGTWASGSRRACRSVGIRFDHSDALRYFPMEWREAGVLRGLLL